MDFLSALRQCSAVSVANTVAIDPEFAATPDKITVLFAGLQHLVW
jgi:hypothetical protein